jgi:hypothetical protein
MLLPARKQPVCHLAALRDPWLLRAGLHTGLKYCRRGLAGVVLGSCCSCTCLMQDYVLHCCSDLDIINAQLKYVSMLCRMCVLLTCQPLELATGTVTRGLLLCSC